MAVDSSVHVPSTHLYLFPSPTTPDPKQAMVPGCTVDLRKRKVVLGECPNFHDFEGLPEDLGQK